MMLNSFVQGFIGRVLRFASFPLGVFLCWQLQNSLNMVVVLFVVWIGLLATGRYLCYLSRQTIRIGDTKTILVPRFEYIDKPRAGNDR